jgi:2-polyprenyl-3-methyl-5-hydroxy-6-metoxy-1,4-benzoquinol methylase
MMLESLQEVDGLSKRFTHYLKTGLRHPARSAMFTMQRVNRDLKLTRVSRVRNRGERLVVNDWEAEKKGGAFVSLAHLHRYEWVSGLVKGKRCLDAGCGSGYGTHYLATHGAGETVGVDISAKAIKFAGRRYGDEGLDFLCMDVREMDFEDDEFDAAVSFDVMEHIDAAGQERFLREITRVVQPGGMAVIGCPNALLSLGRNPFHLHELSPVGFEEILGRHFGDITVFGQSVTIPGLVKDGDWRARAAEICFEDLAITKGDCELAIGLLAVCLDPVKRG